MKTHQLTVEQIANIITEYDNYLWNENSFNGQDRLSLQEWLKQFLKKNI